MNTGMQGTTRTASNRRPRRRSHSRCVLFALSASTYPTRGLQRALALARIMEAELHIVRVLARTRRFNVLFPEENLTDAILDVERAVDADGATAAWLDAHGYSSLVERVTIAQGAFIDEVSARAAGIGAELIVMPSRDANLGSTVARLTRASGIPVFVARGATSSTTVVAATSLEHSSYPVVHGAAEFARRFDVPLVALHNMSPPTETIGLSGIAAEARRSHLEATIARIAPGCEAVLRQEHDPAGAILLEARIRDADIIVVGARTTRRLAKSVAEEVVTQSRRSVLVTPIDEEASSRD